jgi:gamma-tubulin complex component 2
VKNPFRAQEWKEKFPKGAALISHIYEAITREHATERKKTLLRLFVQISKPYFKQLEKWVFEGHIDDYFEEFIVKRNPQLSQSKPLDYSYWEASHSVSSTLL